MSVVTTFAAAKMGASLLGAYGKLKSADSEAALLNAKADMTLITADEQSQRMATLNKQLEVEARATQGTQEGQLAGSGVDVSSGSSILLLEDTATRLATQLVMNERQDKFNQWAAATEAESLRQSGSNIQSAAKISAFASILGSGAETYKLTS